MRMCSTPLWIRGFDMTDRLGPGRRGLALSAVLPGLPQLAVGRWGVGGLGLTVWIAFLAVLLTGWARFAAAWGGPLDHQIASLTVVAGLLGTWGWSMVDVSRPVELDRSGVSQWRLAVQAFKKNRIAVIGAMVVVGLLDRLVDTVDRSLRSGHAGSAAGPPGCSQQ